MQFARTLCASLVLTAAFVAPAAAQRYVGDDVSVNSSAIGRGYLLYPGGKYGRQVRHLLQPGERPGGRIFLHMPVHHHVARSVTPKPVRVASLPPPPMKPSAKSPSQVPVTTDLNQLPEDSAARLVGGSTAPSKPFKPPVQPTHTTPDTAPPSYTGATTVPFSFGRSPATPPSLVRKQRVASAAPPPAVNVPSVAAAAGMKKQSSILFLVGDSSPAASDVGAIHTLAATLNTALSSGASRIQLDAYGGPRGDKSSDSRRLSLKRALVVRELLIEDGVPSEKIDVRAMGGADDSGVADRVDVFVHA